MNADQQGKSIREAADELGERLGADPITWPHRLTHRPAQLTRPDNLPAPTPAPNADVAAARKAVASMARGLGRRDFAAFTEAGRYDDGEEMQIALLAIRFSRQDEESTQ